MGFEGAKMNIKMTPEMVAEQLGRTGLCICPGFLSQKALCETRADLDAIQSAGGFYRAGTGKGVRKKVNDLVRRDEIHWLDRVLGNPVQSGLWEKLDSLKQALNRTLYLGLADFEGHYAVYPEGGFYRRHLDCFRKDDARKVSLVLYLNQDWKPSHGGQLRIYSSSDSRDGSHVDVDPVGGTMVCFMSRESEHEVRLNYRPRFSFTGWFK